LVTILRFARSPDLSLAATQILNKDPKVRTQSHRLIPRPFVPRRSSSRDHRCEAGVTLFHFVHERKFRRHCPSGKGFEISRSQADQNCPAAVGIVPLTRIWGSGREGAFALRDLCHPGLHREPKSRSLKVLRLVQSSFPDSSTATDPDGGRFGGSGVGASVFRPRSGSTGVGGWRRTGRRRRRSRIPAAYIDLDSVQRQV
jgi:hypothetical protein